MDGGMKGEDETLKRCHYCRDSEPTLKKKGFMCVSKAWEAFFCIMRLCGFSSHQLAVTIPQEEHVHIWKQKAESTRRARAFPTSALSS